MNSHRKSLWNISCNIQGGGGVSTLKKEIEHELNIDTPKNTS